MTVLGKLAPVEYEPRVLQSLSIGLSSWPRRLADGSLQHTRLTIIARHCEHAEYTYAGT